MGMFDSIYEGTDWEVEWQTKAYDRQLDVYRIGSKMPNIGAGLDYQVEIFGGPYDSDRDDRHSLATIRDGRLATIDDVRIESLPLVNYGGNIVERGTSDD